MSTPRDPLEALAATDPHLGKREQEDNALGFAASLCANPEAGGDHLLRAIASAAVISANRLGRIEAHIEAIRDHTVGNR